MNTDLATELTAIVIDKNNKETFVQKNGLTYRLLSEKDYDIGEVVTGFTYSNQDDQLVLTTTIPDIRPNYFGWGEVVKVNRRLGVFVNVGWEEKDVVVSMDDLPAEGRLWPKEGDKLYLSITVDDKDRIWGQLADEEQFFDQYIEGSKDMHNQNVAGYAFQLKMSGTYAMTDDGYILFIHPSEREAEPRLGQRVEGRVIGVREDGVLYASLKPRAHEVMEEDAMMLLEMLKRSEDKRIPYHNKSNPEDIRKQFGISKAQFKRAVGRLMKHGLVNQDDEYTHLIKEPDEDMTLD